MSVPVQTQLNVLGFPHAWYMLVKVTVGYLLLKMECVTFIFVYKCTYEIILIFYEEIVCSVF